MDGVEGSSSVEDRASATPTRARESLGHKLTRRLRRRRNAKDTHDDMRRAGDGQRDQDSGFEEMLVAAYRK